MTAEFDCEGCGIHVFAFGISKPPVSGFCSVCGWLNQYIKDPVEMMDVLHRMTPRSTSSGARAGCVELELHTKPTSVDAAH